MKILNWPNVKLFFAGRTGFFRLKAKLYARMPWRLIRPRQSPGHLTHLEGTVLHLLARQVPPGGKVVEIGSFKGRSASYLADGLSPDARLYCVDPWTSLAMTQAPEDVFDQFQHNTRFWADRIIPIRQESVRAGQSWSAGPIDLLWIDGDHSYEGCRADILAWAPHMRMGGLMAFHDYGNPCGVRQAVEEEVRSRCEDVFTLDSLFVGRLVR